MRFRAGLALCFFSILVGAGCRKPLTPNIDRNLAPETWITAAPQDTITTRDQNGVPVQPHPGTIPFRYHLYWAGADPDGDVAGFYFAVVETVGTPGLPTPPLPGPKPRDYHYTTRRDSTFIFSVIEGANTREHAFFIYAVDNSGKADATPARIIFNALDRFPPVPILDVAQATGLVFDPNNLDAPRHAYTRTITDTFNVRVPFARDTVASGSQLLFRWHADLTIADNPAQFYRFKLDNPEFVTVPGTVTEKQYNTDLSNTVTPGPKIFTLRAVDQAGGARASPETTRKFLMNLSPDSWFAGPDSVPASNPSFYTTITDGNGHSTRYHDINGPNWRSVEAHPGSLLHPDSVQILPARRKPNRTFFELYKNRVYVRAEGDTIDMNSWVLFHNGGFDPDSPYKVRIVGANPAPNFPDSSVAPVLRPRPPNGSPIGFRYYLPVFLDSIGPKSGFPQSQTYPLSDPTLVQEPHIGGYQGMQQSGRAYAIVRAQDGDGALDTRIGDPVDFVDSVETNKISPSSPRYALRSKVLTFYVNRAPYLLTDQAAFEPRPNKNYPTRTIPLRLDLVFDDDPYDPATQRTVGGPEVGAPVNFIFRYSVNLIGASIYTGRDTVYAPDLFRRRTGVAISTSIDVPSYIRGPNVTVLIELCDCKDCEGFPGSGRCRKYTIPVTVPALPAQQSAPASGVSLSEGPGSIEGRRGSKQP
jgi:hypothetical protein